MLHFHSLGNEEAPTLAVVSFLVIDDILDCALASSSCQALMKVALRQIRLQTLGGENPAQALIRLMRSSLTDQGAALVELDITFCKSITNDLLKSLPKLPALQRLALDGCQEVDDQGLFAVAQRCQWLHGLSLYWNTRATDKGFSGLMRGQKGKQLKNVSFSGCKQLTYETVQRLISRAPDVEVLDLTRCNNLSDAGALLVCESLDKLRVLRFYAMAHLSSAAFTSLWRLPHLEELDLCGCLVKDEALLEFFEAAATSRLQRLNLTWCLALTDATAFAVAHHCPLLVWLSYFGNRNITDAGVEALAIGPCERSLRELDVRGLTQAPKYSTGREALLQLLPRLVCTELHS